MICCKAGEFGGWCEPLDADRCKDGKEYCNLHAPKDSKRGTPEEVNKLIHDLIASAIADGVECNLSGIVVPNDISFSQYNKGRPLPPINFKKATFSGNADFFGATFSGEAHFLAATFSEEANFLAATFGGKTCFTRAIFSKEVIFSSVIFSKEAIFTRATFSGKALFVERRKHMFNMPALFNEITSTSTSMIIFKRVDFSSVPFSFLDTNLAFFRFDKCTWPRKKYSGFFARLINKIQLTSDEGAVFYDEIQATDKLSSAAKQLQQFGMIEDLYRQMKVNSQEEHNEPEASRWHYREKEMFRKKKLGRRYSPSVTTLYWAFSGYGERPVRAGGILLLLFVAIAIVMNGLGLRSGSSPPKEIIQGFSLLPDMEKIGKVTQAVIEHALFVKDPILIAHPGWSGVLFTCWTKILIPIQSALFIFALRNKFRR